MTEKKPAVITAFAGEAVDKFLKTHGFLPSEECPKRLGTKCETSLACASGCLYANDPIHPNRLAGPPMTSGKEGGTPTSRERGPCDYGAQSPAECRRLVRENREGAMAIGGLVFGIIAMTIIGGVLMTVCRHYGIDPAVVWFGFVWILIGIMGALLLGSVW